MRNLTAWAEECIEKAQQCEHGFSTTDDYGPCHECWKAAIINCARAYAVERVQEERELEPTRAWYEKRCAWYGDELDRRRAENKRLGVWKQRYDELLALLDQRDGPPVYSQVLERAERAEADRAALLAVADYGKRLLEIYKSLCDDPEPRFELWRRFRGALAALPESGKAQLEERKNDSLT